MKKNVEWIQKDASSKLLRYVGYVVSAIILFIFVFFIYGQFFAKNENLNVEQANEYTREWTVLHENQTTETVVLPHAFSTLKDREIQLSTVLPEDIDGCVYMSFLTRWNMKIYVDDELRSTFDVKDNTIPGGYVKSRFVLVPLKASDSGKTLTMVREITEEASFEFTSVYYGERIGIFKILINQYGISFMLACVLLVLSIMVMITGFVLLIVYHRKMPIILLSYSMILVSLWFVFDSFLYQILFGNSSVDGPMEYMLIMIFPFFLLRYMNYEQERRYEKVYTIISILVVVNFITMTVLHFTGLRAYDKNLIFTGMNAVLAIILFMVTMVIDLVKRYIKRYRLVAIGLGLNMLMGVVQIVVLNTQTDVHEVLYMIFGFFLLLNFGLVHLVWNVRQIEAAAQREKHANELKTNFLANMSHEIRTPVNAILGMNEIIARESNQEEIRNYAGDVLNAGETLLGIINDILDFSKIESGKMTLVEASYELKPLLKNLNSMISIRAKQENLQFTMEIDPNMPAQYVGDCRRIEQILINILNNAVKYTREGSVTFRIGLNSAQEPAGEKLVMLHFEVEDTGIGIRKEDMALLFKTFERIDLKNNRSIEGTGLGLSITNALTKLMNGTITVESEYGKGSKFIVDIPQLVEGDAVIGRLEGEKKEILSKPGQTFLAPAARILVVDDMPINVRVVAGLLKKNQIKVATALSGQACLEEYAKENFDLIFLDHMMPDMDGIETLNELKNRYDHLCPIIVLTANAIDGMREMYIEKGFDDYLSKPTKPEELEAILLRYLPKDKIQYNEVSE